MRNMVCMSICVFLLSGCVFIFQDGEQLQKQYGIHKDEAVVLTQQIKEARSKVFGPELFETQTAPAAPQGPSQDTAVEPAPVKIK